MSPALQLRAADGRTFTITAPVRLGRDSACQIRLDDGLVSRVHASVWAEGPALRVRDEGSSNGTYFNGERLEPNRVYNLRPNDELRLGHTTFTVEPAPAGAFQPAPAPHPEPPAPSAAERAPASAPPTIHMPAQARPAPAPAAPPAPPARRRSSLPIAGVAGCLIVCLVLVCGGGGLYAAQRPPLVQTALAQLGPSVPGGTGTPIPLAATAVVPVGTPVTVASQASYALTPYDAAGFTAAHQSLLQTIAELNQAELAYLQAASTQARSPFRAGLARLFTAQDNRFEDMLSNIQNLAAKGGGQAQLIAQTVQATGTTDIAANALYEEIGKQAYALSLQADSLLQQLRAGQLDVRASVDVIADYGSRLRTYLPGGANAIANPFAPYLANPASLPTLGQLTPAQAATLQSQLGDTATLQGWLAASDSTVVRQLTVPADLPLTALDPALVEALATGQLTDPAQIAQVAAANLDLLTGLHPADPANPDPLTSDQHSLTGGIVLAEPGPDGSLNLPAFPGGTASAVTSKPDTAAATPTSLVVNMVDLGDALDPSLIGNTALMPVEAYVGLTASVTGVQRAFSDSGLPSYYADFTLTWTNRYPDRTINFTCLGDPGVRFPGQQGLGGTVSDRIRAGSQPGSHGILCTATGPDASGKPITAGAVAVSYRITDEGELATATPSATVTLDKTADAVGTEVAGTQAAEFNQTATALAANADRFATQTAAARTGGDDDRDGITNANDRCFDQSETKNGWRDEDGCPDNLPTVNVNFAFTENVKNGPLATFASQANLVANFAASTLTGSHSGGGSWDGTYICFNTSDRSEIYEVVDARYNATYTAQVTGTATGNTTGSGGTFQGTLTATGRTDIYITADFTHPECTRLNTLNLVDNWTGTGTVTGAWDGNTFANLTTNWTVRDIGFGGTGGGAVTLTEN